MVIELLVAALAAVAVGAAVLGVGAAWNARRERKLLLQKLYALNVAQSRAVGDASVLFRQGTDQRGALWQMLRKSALLEDTSRVLEEAGLVWTPIYLTRLTIFWGASLPLVTYLVTGGGAWTLAAGVAGVACPSMYVRRARAKRRKKLEEQLPEAIDLLGRAIRAGHALATGFRLVAEESPEPIASEFRRTFEEQKYGMPFEDSMHELTRRMGLLDVRVMVVAILVQREVGGNLTEILDKLSNLLRARFSLRRQVRVYTAQGRMSGYVLGLMPLALAGVISLVNPGYLGVLFTDPLGKVMLYTAVVLQVVGYVWIWRVLKLDF